jgi:two-component system alkaline phosphatase synthesis response regulator PhoP
MTHILLIEDDTSARKLIGDDLELEGYKVSTAADGLAGLEAARRAKPDLIILDVTMPKMNGYDVCRTLRREGASTPILMMTARGQESEKVLGLDLGADDYVIKPVGSLELLARVRALLRRQKAAADALEEASFLDVNVSFKKMEATKNGKSLSLTRKEFQLLELLLRHRGDVVSRDQFLEEIWGYDSAEFPNTRTVDTQVMTLRQKLAGKRGDPSAYIQTVHGIGYKFVA